MSLKYTYFKDSLQDYQMNAAIESGTMTNSADTDQTLHNVASDQGIQCLQKA